MENNESKKLDWNEFKKKYNIAESHGVWRIIKEFWENWDNVLLSLEKGSLHILVDLLLFAEKNPNYMRKGAAYKGLSMILMGVGIVLTIALSLLLGKSGLLIGVSTITLGYLLRPIAKNRDKKDRNSIAESIVKDILNHDADAFIDLVDQYCMGTIILFDNTKPQTNNYARYPYLPFSLFSGDERTMFDDNDSEEARNAKAFAMQAIMQIGMDMKGEFTK